MFSDSDDAEYMDFPTIIANSFTPGQVFRMINTYYYRKTNEIYSYATLPEFTHCMATLDLQYRYLFEDNKHVDCCTVKEMETTEEDCQHECTMEGKCTGFEYREGKCLLKHGDFIKSMVMASNPEQFDLNAVIVSRVYSKDYNTPQYIPPRTSVDPVISLPPIVNNTFQYQDILNISYDHYDYSKGINDIANTIKSRLQSEIIFLLDWNYTKEFDPADIPLYIDYLNRAHSDNGSPIQFKLRDSFLFDDAVIEEAELYSIHSLVVYESNVIQVISGNIDKEYGYATNLAVYIDTDRKDKIKIGYTLVHEIGHYLGLMHTFDNGCDPGDYVNDTKPIIRNEFGSFGPNSCGYAGDVRTNFMDYDETGIPSYTPGQVYRMMIFAFVFLLEQFPQYVNGIIE